MGCVEKGNECSTHGGLQQMNKHLSSGSTRVIPSTETGLQQASELIRSGETVAFPTETVYGLGANALDAQAVNKIFQAKGRPGDNPLIIHICSREQLSLVASEVPDEAVKLIDEFWPGPLTLILPKQPGVPLETTGGLQTVAVRFPAHPIAIELIKMCGVPLAAPSANRSGKPSPTSAGHVLEDLQGRIAGVIDGGFCKVGVESSVLDLTVSPPALLRPGAVTAEQISAVLGVNIMAGGGVSNQDGPKAPGMKYAHYAPNGELYLVGHGQAEVETIKQLVRQDQAKGFKVGVLATAETAGLYEADVILACGRRDQLDTIAQGLYPALREFDKLGAQRIYAETYPTEGIGLAIMNRLTKPAGGKRLG
ncbi:MAG: putative translation factor [Bacilli bacterium]|nr:putative translation factor [Bacilli bacterium]